MHNLRHSRWFSTLSALVVALALGVGLTACTMDENGDDDTQNTTQQGDQMSSDDAMNDDDLMMAEVTTDTPAAGLRADLVGLLDEHVIDAFIATEAIYSEAPYVDAAVANLNTNTADLKAAIASLYGDEAANQFEAIWDKHIGPGFAAYATGAREGDQEAMDQAVASIDEYLSEISAFFAGATTLPESAVNTSVQSHIGIVKQTLDNYASGDAEATFDSFNTATKQIQDVADALARGIVGQMPDEFTQSGEATQTDTTAAGFRADLTRMLVEHVGYAFIATEAIYSEATYQDAAVANLNRNTEELGDAVSSVYGDDAGEQFVTIWNKHIGPGFAAYAAGAREGDQAAMDDAVTSINTYVEEISAFFAGATDLSEDSVQTAIESHVGIVKQALDNYASGDADATFESFNTAIVQIQGVADTLAEGIVQSQPDALK